MKEFGGENVIFQLMAIELLLRFHLVLSLNVWFPE